MTSSPERSGLKRSEPVASAESGTEVRDVPACIVLMLMNIPPAGTCSFDRQRFHCFSSSRMASWYLSMLSIALTPGRSTPCGNGCATRWRLQMWVDLPGTVRRK
jgi:hypothetical protein